MNSQLKPENTTSPKAMDVVLTTSQQQQQQEEGSGLIDVRKKSWWVEKRDGEHSVSKFSHHNHKNKLNNGTSVFPGHDKKFNNMTKEIGKDLAAIASSLDQEGAEKMLMFGSNHNNTSTAPTKVETGDGSFNTFKGVSTLRPTAHGRAMKEGLEIKSRRFQSKQVVDLRDSEHSKALLSSENARALLPSSAVLVKNEKTSQSEILRHEDESSVSLGHPQHNEVDDDTAVVRPSAHGTVMGEGSENKSKMFRTKKQARGPKGCSEHGKDLLPRPPRKDEKEITPEAYPHKDEPIIPHHHHHHHNDDEISKCILEGNSSFVSTPESQFQDSVRSCDVEQPEPLWSKPFSSPMRPALQLTIGPITYTPAKCRGNLWSNKPTAKVTAIRNNPVASRERGDVSDSESSSSSSSSSSSEKSLSSTSSEAISTRSSSHAEHSSVLGEGTPLGTSKRTGSLAGSNGRYLRPNMVRGLSLDDLEVPFPKSPEKEETEEKCTAQSPDFNHSLRPQMMRGTSIESIVEPPPLVSEGSASEDDSASSCSDSDDSEDEKATPNITIVLRSASTRAKMVTEKKAFPARSRRAGRRPEPQHVSKKGACKREDDDDSFCGISPYETLRMSKPKKFRRQPGSFQLRRVTRKPPARVVGLKPSFIRRGISFRVPAPPCRQVLRRPTFENQTRPGNVSRKGSIGSISKSQENVPTKEPVLRRPTFENIYLTVPEESFGTITEEKPFNVILKGEPESKLGKRNSKTQKTKEPEVRLSLEPQSSMNSVEETDSSLTPTRDNTTTAIKMDKDLHKMGTPLNEIETISVPQRRRNSLETQTTSTPRQSRRNSVGSRSLSPSLPQKEEWSSSPVTEKNKLIGWEKPVWTAAQLRPTGQKERIETVGNLAKPITFPPKADLALDFRSKLRQTPHGKAMQEGGAILSRRARRRQEISFKQQED